MTLSKQFVALATGSNLSKHFQKLRLKIFLLTTAVLIGLFVITSFSVVQFSRVRFEQAPVPELRNSNGRGGGRDVLREDLISISQLVRQQNINDLTETVILTNSIVVAILLFILWLSLELILRPISRVYQDKEDFLKHASHDLRTPLAVLKSDLQLAQKSKTTDQYSQAIQDGLVQVNSLHTLASSYLDQMNGEGEIVPTYRKELVNVNELVQKIWNERENQNTLKLKLELPTKPIKIHTNLMLLEQVLKNVIDNAMKYSVPLSVMRLDGTTSQITFQNESIIKEITPGIGIGIIEKNMKLIGGRSLILLENNACKVTIIFTHI
jgi:signal transduction histidine kinase